MTQRKRKRSSTAALVLMMPATGLLLTACSSEPETAAVVYQSVQECQEKNPDASEQCLTDYKQAAALHPQVAPKYQSQQECEADFGAQRCEAAPTSQNPSERQYANNSSGGGGFFMPMMMGYMAGQMFNRPQMAQPSAFSAPGTQPRDNVRRDDDRTGSSGGGGGGAFVRGGANGGVTTQPLYKSRDDSRTFRTADNVAVANRSGAVKVPSQAVSQRVGGARRSGGFGSTAASHNSAGS